jgi:hypothetical protein
MSSTHAIPASIALSPSEIIALRPDAPLMDDQLKLVEKQLKQLDRLTEIGMELAEDLRSGADGKPLNRAQAGHAYDRVTRALRQIHALQHLIAGLREKRIAKVKNDLTAVKKTAIHQSVERSLITGKPDMPREKRERLLADLFRGYNGYSKGTVAELVAQICKDLGTETDMSLWEAPCAIDIELPSGFDWILPANGDKPYTRVMTEAGHRARLPFDSPHLERYGKDPPKRE